MGCLRRVILFILVLGAQEGYLQQRVGLQQADCALKPPSDSIRTEQIPYALQKRVILYRLEVGSSNELFLCSGGGGAARVPSLFFVPRILPSAPSAIGQFCDVLEFTEAL